MAYKHVNRIAAAARGPSIPEINRKRRLINSLWSPEERTQRARGDRKLGDPRFEAHVRFLRFLVEQTQ